MYYEKQKAEAKDAYLAQCAVSGEEKPLARIHSKIKGVYGGLATGSVLTKASGSTWIPYLSIAFSPNSLHRRLQRGTPFQSPKQGHFINILQVSAHRNAAGDSADFYSSRLDQLADVHGCCLSLKA